MFRFSFMDAVSLCQLFYDMSGFCVLSIKFNHSVGIISLPNLPWIIDAVMCLTSLITPILRHELQFGFAVWFVVEHKNILLTRDVIQFCFEYIELSHSAECPIQHIKQTDHLHLKWLHKRINKDYCHFGVREKLDEGNGMLWPLFRFLFS